MFDFLCTKRSWANFILVHAILQVRVDKNLPDGFAIQNGLKLGDALSSLLFTVILEYAIRKFQATRRD
jgi:hypothetical protein